MKDNEKLKRCNGSDGKAKKDSGLKGPGFNPRPRQEQCCLLFLFVCFGVYEIYLEVFDILMWIHVAINNHGYIVIITIKLRQLMLNLIGCKLDALIWIIEA